MKVGIIGLGIMGSSIARNLMRAGSRVAGYDIDGGRRAELQADGLTACASAAEVAGISEVMLTSLPSVEALDDTVSGLLAAPNEGQIIAELSTLPIEAKLGARDALAGAGITLLDCAISGTGAQAVTGDLAVYASGGKDAFDAIAPLFDGFARVTHYLGEFGNGSKMKFIANLLVAINNVASAEAITLGIKAGLEPDAVCRVIASGAGSSRIFELRGPLMAEARYQPPTMTMAVWQKDMAIITAFAESLGVETPMFSASAPIYKAAMEMGLGDQDTAAVCTVLERMSGIERSTKGD